MRRVAVSRPADQRHRAAALQSAHRVLELPAKPPSHAARHRRCRATRPAAGRDAAGGAVARARPLRRVAAAAARTGAAGSAGRPPMRCLRAVRRRCMPRLRRAATAAPLERSASRNPTQRPRRRRPRPVSVPKPRPTLAPLGRPSVARIPRRGFGHAWRIEPCPGKPCVPGAFALALCMQFPPTRRPTPISRISATRSGS